MPEKPSYPMHTSHGLLVVHPPTVTSCHARPVKSDYKQSHKSFRSHRLFSSSPVTTWRGGEGRREGELHIPLRRHDECTPLGPEFSLIFQVIGFGTPLPLRMTYIRQWAQLAKASFRDYTISYYHIISYHIISYHSRFHCIRSYYISCLIDATKKEGAFDIRFPSKDLTATPITVL